MKVSSEQLRHRATARGLASVALALIVCTVSSCASLDVERKSETSGTFTSTALSFTLVSFDAPGPALSIARGNAADTGLPDLIVEHETVFPYFGPLDWILDILSVRYARVIGTWGVPEDAAADED